MAVTKKDIENSLVQLRKIAAHREVGAEKEIRKIYKALVKDLKQFVGYEYAEFAKDGKLTFDILLEKGEYARFLEEVERRVENIRPDLSKEIKGVSEDTYTLMYNGLQKAVVESTTATELQSALKGLQAVRPEAINRIIQTGLVDEVLQKNWQDHIYDIKRCIAISLKNGDRVETMAQRIAKATNSSYERAICTARTESHRTREAGFSDCALDINDTLKQGVTSMRMTKRWRTMNDERVRPNQRVKTKKGWKTYTSNGANHKIMEGQLVEADDMFILSDGTKTMAPGQSGVANQDINCRCRASYNLMSDEEFFNETGKHFKGFGKKVDTP